LENLTISKMTLTLVLAMSLAQPATFGRTWDFLHLLMEPTNSSGNTLHSDIKGKKWNYIIVLSDAVLSVRIGL
jgi:hypothetical protein